MKMSLSPEQLDEIENFAGLYFTVEEISQIMEMDIDVVREFYQDKSL